MRVRRVRKSQPLLTGSQVMRRAAARATGHRSPTAPTRTPAEAGPEEAHSSNSGFYASWGGGSQEPRQPHGAGPLGNLGDFRDLGAWAALPDAQGAAHSH